MTTTQVQRRGSVRAWIACQVLALVLLFGLFGLFWAAVYGYVSIAAALLAVAPIVGTVWLVDARRSWWAPEVRAWLADPATRRWYRAGMVVVAVFLFGATLVASQFTK
jgi:hypothetical protein